MRRPPSRLRHRVRQRRRMLVIAFAGFAFLAGIGLTIFIQTARVDDTRAGEQTRASRIVTIPEEHYVNDPEIAAPVIRNTPLGDDQTQLVRIAKPLTTGAESRNQ